MDIALFFTVFMTLFLVELPDKTFIATLVLATKYRPLYVWLGVSAAFLVQTIVAIAFGTAINALPETPVHVLVMALFLIAGIVLIRGAKSASEDEAVTEEEFAGKARPAEGVRAIGASFFILFLAEWGDLSQLATAGFVARGGNPFVVGVASFAALAFVSGLGAALGRVLLKRISLSLIQTIGGVVCLIFAALMALSLAGVKLPSWMPV